MDDARIELEDSLHLESDVDFERISSEAKDYESSQAEYEISAYAPSEGSCYYLK